MWSLRAAALVITGMLLGLLGGCQNNATPETDSADRSAAATDSAAKGGGATGAVSAHDTSSERSGSRDLRVPEGMAHVPAGRTKIGIEAERWKRLRQERSPGPRHLFGRDAHPPFWAQVDSFFLDTHPVTVAQFRDFVEATGYTTQAEEFGDAGVLVNGQWQLVDGATWRRPRGPNQPEAPDDHPVTQVSWNDAEAYCEWAGKRLPTEVEWEHAAREGRNERFFCPWNGSCRDPSVRAQHANTWQGQYPLQNTVVDGYRYTSPVGAFGANRLGLQDMSGNVWEWTANWKRPYDERGTDFEPTRRSEKVQRGGSFICSECGGYYVFARSSATPETSLFHVGIRCAQSP